MNSIRRGSQPFGFYRIKLIRFNNFSGFLLIKLLLEHRYFKIQMNVKMKGVKTNLNERDL